MSHDDGTVTISAQKWQLIKNTIGMLFAQETMIVSLAIVSGAHGKIVRELAARLGYELPEDAWPEEVDPEVVRRMNQGLIELEKMINSEEDPPEKGNA